MGDNKSESPTKESENTKFQKSGEDKSEFSDNMTMIGSTTSKFSENETLSDDSTLIVLENKIKAGMHFDELFQMLIEIVAKYHHANMKAFEQCLSFQSLKHHEK